MVFGRIAPYVGLPVNNETPTGNEMPSETSADIAARVARAREMQEARFKDNRNIYYNAQHN